uniref:C2H2-type domain-containing protein n=1 Tax=Phlebotomus papatasi TaxID=29031 RepID=A0A1B0D8Y7_PHLPP
MYLNKHKKTHSETREPQIRKHLCDICGYRAKDKTHHVEHMNWHAGVKPYKCQDCGKDFVRKDALRIHRMTHTGEKPFECQICSKFFRTKAQMKAHITTHTGDRNFSCKYCDKSYSQIGGLSYHVRTTHAGEKPFQCPTCSKSFSLKHLLQAHIRIHTGERPFECPTCSKSFRSRSNQQRHRKICPSAPENQNKSGKIVEHQNLTCSTKNKYSSYLKFICVPCSSKVETTYDFKTQCEKTYTKLINKVKDYFESESADSEIPCDSYDWLYIAVESPRSDDGLNETDKENVNETINKKYFGRTYSKKNINLPKVRNDVEDCNLNDKSEIEDEDINKSINLPEVRNDVKDSNLNDKSEIEDEDINKSINLPEVRNDVEDNDLNDKNKIEDEDINKSINLPEVRNDVEDDDLNDKSEIEDEEYMEKSYSELFQVVETYDPSEYKNIKLPDIDEIWPELINQSKRRIFECAHCDKAFKHRVGKHFPCYHCERIFTTKFNLKQHILIHTEIKDHTCTYCGKSFSSAVNLTMHERIHTGIKYECAKCWKTYVHKRSLQRHLKQCISSKKTEKKKQIKKMNNTKRNETIEE